VSPKIVHLVAAARPNFMKVAPLYHELARGSWCTARIVHTGQHYDANMSDAFFRDLRLPEPAHHLEVGSGSHAEQTGRTMIAYEGVCQRERPAGIGGPRSPPHEIAPAVTGTAHRSARRAICAGTPG
jgi:UDP-N-acetylglucosamine 2-epimerase